MKKINLKGLLDYQALDLPIFQLEKEFANSPESLRVRDTQNKVKMLVNAIAALNKEAQEVVRGIEQCGADIEKELEANGKLVNNFDKLVDLDDVALENTILTALDAKIEKAEKDIARLKRRLEDISAELKAKSADASKGLEILNVATVARSQKKQQMAADARDMYMKLKAVGSEVDPDALAIYNAIRNDPQKPLPAVVEIVNGCCGGCGMEIAIEMAGLKDGEAAECPNCGRIVFKA